MMPPTDAEPPPLQAQGYDRHVELRWQGLHQPGLQYQLAVSVNGGNWQHRITTTAASALDFVGELGRNLTLRYKLVAVKDGVERELARARAETRDFSDAELLEMVQRYTFRYFWDHADPASGWAREREPNEKDGDIITSGGTGFGVMAVIVGAERGWITRAEAVQRLLKLTRSLREFERFHGMWAHWYHAGSRQVFHFSRYDDGGDIVESAFMAQGLLTARQYFDGDTAPEQQLRREITALWREMEWDWYTKGENVLYWHWSKSHAWRMNHPIRGYNEALIVYVLAAASPTHPIAAPVYHEGWAGWDNKTFRNYRDYYGMVLPLGPADQMGGPLFFAHYSFLGLNPKGLRDRYADYWQQNYRHTRINRAYCIDNPYGWSGYGENFWGLTAGDKVPSGYAAHAPGFLRDQGTITPTAALSSMPYTPAASMQVLKNLYFNHGKTLFGPMGFYDGINLSVSDKPAEQVRKTYLAIDQGPIVVMLENHRSGLLWKYFMRDPDVRAGLQKLDFKIDGKPIR
ncbi:beta-glucosidase [Exilibacterium tricleocarpae]|uniref:Beta-glucosidase n=2 Tax=Exilibacterium tricleocarpae TaxID=2591008 RepID=A0A545UA38_9GAMM|nr:beta-glucosidase [Exilibacterium tricleocarpae]